MFGKILKKSLRLYLDFERKTKMNTSEKGKNLIKNYEGLRLKAYRCPSNKLTIGYGHTANVKENDVITKEQAENYLTQDLKRFENAVNRLVKVSLTQNQFDALVSFAFNLGAGENIYNLSYYGLLSPIILISYLLPFIPMYIYMLIAVFLSITASSILFYKWINNKYNSEIAFISTLMLILNSTYIYQCHRHIMFVIHISFTISHKSYPR